MRFEGIKHLYPRVPLGVKIRAFIAMTRPSTLVAAILAGFSLNYVFATMSGRGTTFLISIFVGLVLGFLQAGGQCLNQSIEEEVLIDKLNGKVYRPTVMGIVSLTEGKILSSILFLSGILLAFYMSLGFGFFSLIICFFGVSYTVPPFRIKKRFILNNVHQGIARGLLPALYVASAYGYGRMALLLGIPLTIWVSVFQTSKDFGDTFGDQSFNIKTLPVVLGVKKAIKVMSISGSLPFIVLVFLVYFGFLPINFLWLLLLIIPSVAILLSINKKLGKFENNLGWLIFYMCLAGWYLLPALLI